MFMNKDLINYSKFVLSCGILAGICLFSLKNNFSESNLEKIILEEFRKDQTEKKDSLSVEIPKRKNYETKRDGTFYFNYLTKYEF